MSTMNPYDKDKAPETREDHPESEDNTQVADAGIPGQILYPDREVDAKRAAGWAAGKEDSLYDTENDAGKPREGWQNPADRPTEEQGEPGVPGDESGEETEPAAMRHEPVEKKEER